MSKKKNTGLNQVPMYNVDSLKGIFEFSRIKERRNLSCVSSIFLEAFYESREECTKIAMLGLVQERRDRYEFPTVSCKEQTIRESLPKKYRLYTLNTYLTYQIQNLIWKEMKEGRSLQKLFSFIENNKFEMCLLCKFETVQLMSNIDNENKIVPMDSDKTIISVLQDHTDQSSIDAFKDIIEDGDFCPLHDHISVYNDCDGNSLIEESVYHYWNRLHGWEYEGTDVIRHPYCEYLFDSIWSREKKTRYVEKYHQYIY